MSSNVVSNENNRDTSRKRRSSAASSGAGERIVFRNDSGLWIVDRMERGFAVLEDAATKETADYPLADLPQGIREGDALRKDAGGAFYADAEETKRRKERARGLMDRLKRG